MAFRVISAVRVVYDAMLSSVAWSGWAAALACTLIAPAGSALTLGFG